jgi:hypothetical protein
MKDDAAYALAKRKRPGTSTADVSISQEGQTKQLHPKKFTRYLKEQTRHRQVEAITPGLYVLASVFNTNEQ